MSSPEIYDATSQVACKFYDDFANWIPNNIRTHAFYSHKERGAINISNTTAIRQVFQRIGDSFIKIYKRKEFLHHFEGEGLEGEEIEESYENTLDLCEEYQNIQDVVVELDDESEWDDESEEESEWEEESDF